MPEIAEMSERIAYWAGSSIPMALAAWVGIAAFVYGLRRFGKEIKLPLLKIFVAL